MRRGHFESIRPICPRCKTQRGISAPLALRTVLREADGHIIEGIMHCPDPMCRQEYPVIDGVPILVPQVRQYITDHFEPVMIRRDLGETLESLIGDCAGPGTTFDYTRQQVSSYAWDHYGEFDPEEQVRLDPGAPDLRPHAAPDAPGRSGFPGSSVQCLKQLLARGGASPHGLTLDLGCATGRHAFELAALTDGLVLGVDVSFAMLRLAAIALRTGRVEYARRRLGLVYDRRAFEVPVLHPGAGVGAGVERVDFWLCDATALPLADGSASGVIGLNVLDAVASPVALLESIARVLGDGGHAHLACPYDWSGGATTAEQWIGGHSQRSADRGEPVPRLKQLLAGGEAATAAPGAAGSRALQLLAEADDLPSWRVRLHERAFNEYRLHGVVLRKRGESLTFAGRQV